MEPDQFTLEEANSLVAWLEETFNRLAPARQEYLALQEGLTELSQGRTGDGGSTSQDDLARAQESIDELARQVEEGVEEILDRGIIVRDVESGLVDFPSQRDGREIFLCWIRGEAQIGFWHDTDKGFSHREPL